MLCALLSPGAHGAYRSIDRILRSERPRRRGARRERRRFRARESPVQRAARVGCHDRSVHQREARKALTIEGIKAQVRRWDAFLNGAWRDSEVNDVTT
jgi:hypothetical protein